MRQYPDFIERIRAALPLDPGALRHQIQIREKVISGQNSRGEDEYTWSVKQTCYAAIETLAGRELEVMRQRWADAEYKIKTQYMTGIEREMHVLWWDGDAERTLDILDVQDPYSRRDRLIMICREWVE